MLGMDRVTGKPLSGTAHLAQSIGDILTTPIGSRIQRRDYGSALFELIDAPLNGLTRLRAFAATAVAIARWEPRIRLTRVGFADDAAAFAVGDATLQLEGILTEADAPSSFTTLTIPLRPTN